MKSSRQEQPPLLFDESESEFDNYEDASAESAQLIFEDVESEFDDLQEGSQQSDVESRSSTTDYADNALTDEEVRILDDRE